MDGYICPFCGLGMSLGSTNLSRYVASFKDPYVHTKIPMPRATQENPLLRISFYKCPHDKCQKTSIVAEYSTKENLFITQPIYPKVNIQKVPDYIPKAIRDDYMEACMILNDSPKAAATLCRRALQGMIRDFHGIIEKTLYSEIDALQGKIPLEQWNSLNGIREIGNIGAHMEKDVNSIIDIEPEEAHLLVETILYLMDVWYSTRHAALERNNAIKAVQDRIKAAKTNPLNQK